MNWIYTGVYFVDLLRLLLVMCSIFGFSFSKRKERLVGGLFLILLGAVSVLLLKDISNRIFLFLIAQVLFSVLCLEGKKRVLAEVSFLVHFGLLTLDAVAQSMMVFIWYDEVFLNAMQHVVLNVASKLVTLVIVIVLTGIVSTFDRAQLSKYINTFNLKLFLYYFVCITASGIVISYAGIMATDQVMIYRYKVALYIASGVLSIIILIFGILLNAYLVQRNRLRENDMFKQKCIEEQAAQYELITHKNQQLQRFRHDQKAYILVLKNIVEKGDMLKLKQYINELGQKISDIDYIATGNLIGDAILNAQAEKAEKENITFQVIGRFSERMNISDADLASLLSNAVKNACEAAMHCGEKGFVEIRIKSYKQKLFLEIRNSALSAPVFRDGHLVTTKKDKKEHGIGTQNMEDITAKYDGKLTWKYDDSGYVTTKIEI